MKSIAIGVSPQEQIRVRVRTIARGKYMWKPGESKTWFTSMRSVAEVLSRYTARPILRFMAFAALRTLVPAPAPRDAPGTGQAIVNPVPAAAPPRGEAPRIAPEESGWGATLAACLIAATAGAAWWWRRRL